MNEKSFTSIVEALRSLAVGECIELPAEKANSVRACASNYGFQWGRKFVTKANRNARTVSVTRSV